MLILTMNRQTISTPRMFTACASPDSACAKVPIMMIINSTPSDGRTQVNWHAQESSRGALTHPFTTEEIRKPPKEKLANEGSNRSSDLDTQVLIGI